VTDGILNDPRQCHFDPETMLCKEGDSEKCLTAAQVATLKKLYEGPNDAKGRKIFPGYLPGAKRGPEDGNVDHWTGARQKFAVAFSGGYSQLCLWKRTGTTKTPVQSSD